MRGIPVAIPLLAFTLAGCTIIPPSDPARMQMPRSQSGPPPAPPPAPPFTPRQEPPRPRLVAPPPLPAQPYARPVYTPSPMTPPPAPPAAQELPPRVRTSGPLTFAALGETVRVGGISVTPLSVLEDSRCPSNARCAWAGEVRLSIRTGTGKGKTEISSRKPLRVADGTLELVETRPDKIAGSRNQGAIAMTAYRFGFRFSGGY